MITEQQKNPPFVYFEDLQERKIVSNMVTLANMVERLGFPAPFELAENRLAWWPQEIESWLPKSSAAIIRSKQTSSCSRWRRRRARTL